MPSIPANKESGDEKIPVTGVTLNETSMSIDVGDDFQLFANSSKNWMLYILWR